jgi:tripeptide aminopeptidase
MPLSPTELARIRDAAHDSIEAVVDLAMRICSVPAPTGSEQQRGEFVASLLTQRGYTPEIDAVGNVYVRRGKRGAGPVLMLMAHLDTVFPADTPLLVERRDDKVYGPGIGDNSLSVAAMLGVLDLLDEMGMETATDIIAVANVGEEGLGNLRGARAAVERYRDQLTAAIAIDGSLGHVVNDAVGSKRWRVSVHGPGGHSFSSFGRPSAIHGLGRIIAALTTLAVPQFPRTTYNVGMIKGGTSVNTIAPYAEALLDMRSVDVSALEQLASQARSIIEESAGVGLRTEIEVLGERPAGSCHMSEPLVQLAIETLHWLGLPARLGAASTDANIPISLNIPALCVGITQVGQAHTVEEWIAIPPIGDGLAQLLRLFIETTSMLSRR